MKIPGYLSKREPFAPFSRIDIPPNPKDYECKYLNIKRVFIRETASPGSRPMVPLNSPNEYSVSIDKPDNVRLPAGNPYIIPSGTYLEIDPSVLVGIPVKEEEKSLLRVSRLTEGCYVEAEISIYFDADDGTDDPFKAPSDNVMSEQFEKKVEQLFREWVTGPWKEEGN